MELQDITLLRVLRWLNPIGKIYLKGDDVMKLSDFKYVEYIDFDKYEILYKSEDFDFKERLVCYICKNKQTGKKEYFKSNKNYLI